ncbi:MAG TPA: hypothetical protein PKA07_04435 [Micropruina sp.]|nr:hypothetical protein [Micropruina sp.]
MSETDPARPRRAFEPSGDEAARDTGTGDEAGAEQPPRAWALAEPSTAKDTDTEDADVAAPDQPEVSTPIPPPAPALPESIQPPAAGRRFSAEDLADDWVSPAPRRSAVSVSSPPFSPIEAPRPRAGAGRPARDPEPTAVAAGAGSEAGNATVPDGRRRTMAWVIGGVAAVLVIGLMVWFGAQRPGTTATPPAGVPASPSESVTPSPVAALADTQLIADADLAKLLKKTTWSAQDPAAATTGIPPQPSCVDLATTGGAAPESELSRLFNANKGGGRLLQFVQAWPDAASAGTAFDAFVAQAGSCKDALIQGASRVTGLADSATAITVQLIDGTQHTLLLTRTGRFVSLVDGAVPRGADERPSASGLVAASTPSQSRQCGPASGACPATPKVVTTTPPATETPGWLALVDLPLVNLGAGTWTATAPAAPMLSGSQCENVDLAKLPDSTSAAHRIYVLTNDAKAPRGFGIDEVVYTFAKASDAREAVEKLDDNFADCGARTRTATVKDTAVTAPDAAGKDLKSTSYLVTQRINDSRTATFRVGIAAVGNRVVYLMANPAANFDFGNAAWHRIVGRASQRVTQFA